MPVSITINSAKVVGKAPNKLVRLKLTESDENGPISTTEGIIYDGVTVRYPSFTASGRRGGSFRMCPTTPAPRLVNAIIKGVERDFPDLCEEAFGSKRTNE